MTYPIIDVWHGNEFQLQWRGADKEGGLPFNLQGASALLVLKEHNDPDKAAVITRTTENGGIVITDPGNGILVATVPGEMSQVLPSSTNGCPHRDYYSQFKVTLSTSQIIKSATFIIRFNQGPAGPTN